MPPNRWSVSHWLKGHQSEPDLVVLDIRSAIDGGDAQAYAVAHIPGSVHSDYDKAGWRVTRNNVPFMVPTVAELEKLIGDLGIDEDSHVVVVPAGVNVLDFGSAARTYWTLKYAGVKNVSILDGGVAAWKAAGLASDGASSRRRRRSSPPRSTRVCWLMPPRSRKSKSPAAPRWSMRGRLRSFSARKRRRPRRPTATFRAR